MRIILLFQFNHEEAPVAVTGIEGDVHDMLVPCVGDRVVHRDNEGKKFEGRISERIFAYEISQGIGVNGTVAVTLCLDRTTVH